MQKDKATNSIYNIVILFIIFIVVFLCIFFNSFSSFSETLKRNIERNIIFRTAENSYYIKNSIENLQKSIEGITDRSQIKSMEWTSQEPVLIIEGDRYEIESFQVAHTNGASNSTKGYIEDVSSKSYFKEAMNGLSTLSDPIKREYDGKTVILCATPIYDDREQVSGVLIAHMEPQALFSSIENIHYGSSGYGFIINHQGNVMAKSMMTLNEYKYPDFMDFERKGNNLPDEMLRGEIGYGVSEYDGIEYFMSYSPIANTEWSIVISVQSYELFYEVDAVKSRFMAVFLSLMFISMLLVFFSLRSHVHYKKILLLEEETEKSNQLLLESKEIDKLRTEFFANISHELKTPLNVILSSLQLLTLSLNNNPYLEKEKAEKHFSMIKRNSLRLNRLINNLIDTSRISANFYELHLTKCNIVTLLREITMSIDDYVKRKGLSLHFFTDTQEKIISCDIDKIERIILNLLSNAIKFTDEKGKISIWLKDNVTAVLIVVEDTGIGIPKEKINYIFTRFHQVDKTLFRNHEGSGIGLSLVKSMVEMHGGTVEVSSEEGKGTTFTMELPVLSTEPGETDNLDEYRQNQINQRIEVEMSDIL